MREKIIRVAILNPYIATLGGGEKLMGYICQCLENYYGDIVNIDILVHNYNEVDVFDDNYLTIDDLNNRFGLKLERTKLYKIEYEKETNLKEMLKNKRKIENLTKTYDLFINHMFCSKHIGKAKVNIYECMFPPIPFSNVEREKKLYRLGAKLLDYFFYRSYDSIISISSFTNHWTSFYWKGKLKNNIIYPPVFSEKEIIGRYNEEEKSNIIISVGRFFVGSHSKKQLEMVEFFANNQDVFSEYEYHLAGGLSNLPEDIEYLSKITEIASKYSNIIIHVNCKFDDLMELYKKAKIFWHGTGYLVDENKEPEKMEHFGITTVEAMSFGAVPVVIKRGGQTEIVDENKNGFHWESEEECIINTKRLIEDEALRIEFAREASEKAKEYSIEKFYEKNRRVFDELRI